MVSARGKGEETMRSSEALDRKGLDHSPRIGVTAALREETESIAQNPLGRFVRTDLDYVGGCRRSRRGARSTTTVT